MPKTPKKTTSKPKTPYTITKGHKRGLLAQSGKATLENIVALQQHGLKANGKAFNTTKKYDEAVAAGRRWLEEYVGGKAEGKGKGKKGKNKEKDDDSGSEGSDDESDLEEDSSFKFDNPAYRRAFNGIPNVHSPEMVSLYLVYKIYGQGRKIGTADTIHAAFKHMWKMQDGDKYRGKWHFNPTTAAWEGNPIDSAKVQDTMAAIKNKCGKDGGDRKHSLAMSEEFMSRMFAWSEEQCPASKYEGKSTTVEEQNLKTKHLAFKCFASTSWIIWSRCFELIKLQRKHLTFGLEDSKAFNTPYFELQLTNRKGWQKRVNQSHKEADLRSGKFKICAQSGLPACDSFSWMTRWVKYLEEGIYRRPLEPEDYIFPATGANGIVQTGEHISHDDVQKWITEFASGADLPRANGTFSTHCFRRGGAQYRFMFAPVGRRWTLRQVRWWGGWAEGEHRDTLIKYLLDELNTYEDDYSGMLLPTQPDTDKTLLGEASLTAPATAESITMLHQSLSSDIRALSSGFEKLLRIVAESISAPVSTLPPHALSMLNNSVATVQTQTLSNLPVSTTSRPIIPISLPLISSYPHHFAPPQFANPSNSTKRCSFLKFSIQRCVSAFAGEHLLNSTQSIVSAPNPSYGRPLPNHGLIVPDVPVTLPGGSKSKRSDSWLIIVRHWEEGDPAHGLNTPLKDWPKEWLRGANKPLAMKHTNRRTVATEFIDQYKRDKTAFLEAYPEANQGASALLDAIKKARAARGDRVSRK
ncbi:hypothetical protein R3P38DRAFT_2518899 [Favolaschia claudopus]|uniref:Tyr recombinase domain-containing protein n=1 Tax=Favolaschia claudopus TaxID=2862362 RepID=A0AAW0C4J6_9AGAR